MPADWNEVKRLFHACIELEPDDRPAYLDHACAGDDALRGEVLALLAADNQAGDLMRAASHTGATADAEDVANSTSWPRRAPPMRVCLKCLRHYDGGETVCADDGEALADDPESLVGTTIDNLYRVERFLKRGGFGVVYLARHAVLRDRVAIKILPRPLTAEPERFERFLREGRVARSLQHPNLVKVYDLRTSADGLTYMVLEFVEGRTLREEFDEKGPFTPEAIVDLLEPVAAALDEAHQQGIVHRDIKPENIMVSDGGSRRGVKLLDLGIAKLREILAEPLDDSVNVTAPGHVIGTPHYMSPEQWGDMPDDGGPEVDGRADVYSLGVVVYEMVSGRTPFRGRSSGEIRRAHLVATPPLLSALDAYVPEPFARAVAQALEKLRADRPATAGALLARLRRSVGGSDLSEQETIIQPVAPARRPWKALTVAAAIVALVGGGAWFATRWRASLKPPGPPSVKRVTFTGNAMDAAISPDGRQVVAVVEEHGAQSLYLCAVDGSAKVQIVPPSNTELSEITYAHDGRYVYYCASARVGSATLFRIPLPGGTPQPLVADVGSGVAISPDDTELAFIRQDQTAEHADLLVVRADGSNERKLAASSAPRSFAAETPSWSPDGRTIACSMADSANGYRGLVATVTVADGVVRPLETPVDWWYVDRVVWMPDGASLVASIAVDTLGDLELWRVAYPSGATTRLTSDLNSYEGVTAAKDGTLAAVQTSIRQTLWVSTEADASDAHPISTGIEPYLGASWTPDGRVLYSSRRSGNFEVYLSDAAGQQPRQLTFDKAVDRDPVMAPDGRTVFFASNRDGPFHIWKVSIDATSAPQRVTSGGDDEYPAVSPDGQWLVYQGLDPAKLSASICTMRLDATSPTIVSQGYANWPAISPDGRWIAYVQQAASDEHVKGAVIAVAGDSAPKKFEVPILSMPRRNYQRLRWSADSRNVLYIDDTGGVSQVWSMTPGAENRTRLTAFPSDRIFTIDARNGSLLMVRGSVTSDVVVIASAS